MKVLESLRSQVPSLLAEAKAARDAIYTTGGGNKDHPWSPSQLKDLEVLALEHTKKKFRGDKKRRWQHIQKELGLPDRSFKSCQRAFRAVVALQRASATALDAFDTAKRSLAQAKDHHAVCLAYEISCEKKTLSASRLITMQSNLDRELRLTAHLSRGEHDLEGRSRAVALLLSRGRSNAADSGGFSALMAAAHKCLRVVDVLLDHGATLDLSDSDGHSALYYAFEGGAAQAAQLLMRRGAKCENTHDHGKGLIYGALVGEQIEKFVVSERQARDKAERERRWFLSFKKSWEKSQNCVAGDVVDEMTLRTLKQWPPKLPPSRRRAKHSGGIRSPTSLPHCSGMRLSSSRLASRNSISAASQKSVQLPAPTALDALRLGLEGSRQRKDRLQREGEEILRRQALESAEAARPPTYERNMLSAQGHTVSALADVAGDLEVHRNSLHHARATNMHRANTAVR